MKHTLFTFRRTSFLLLLTIVVCGVTPAGQLKQPSAQASDGKTNDSTRKRSRGVIKRTEPLFRISKQTTFFTEPLLKNGHVDYLTALNNSEKPINLTPKNNGAVYLIKAIGRQTDPPNAHTINTWKALGLSKDGKGFYTFPTRNDPVFVNFDYYILLQTNSMNAARKKRYQEQLEESFYVHAQKPWKKGEHPELSKWIEMNAPSLRLLMQGTRKEIFHLPYVWSSPEQTPGALNAVNLPVAFRSRSFTRLLKIRAMRSIEEKRFKSALQDFMTIHKFARQFGTRKTFIDNLIAIATDAVAFYGAQHFIHHPEVPADLLRDYSTKLQTFSAASNMAHSMNTFERCITLDFALFFATKRNEQHNEILEAFGIQGSFYEAMTQMDIDWNLVLIQINHFYDEMEQLYPKQHLKREALIKEKIKTIIKRTTSLRSATGLAKLLLMGRKVRSETVAEVLIALQMPAFDKAFVAEQRGLTKIDLAMTHVALELYKKAHNQYPKSLSNLVPDFLDKVPQDRFIEHHPLKYESAGKEFLLYSVGRDGIDNHGKPPGKAGEENDIVINTSTL